MSLAELTLLDRFRGLLLGTAMGDSLGLPMENLSPGRAKRLFPGNLHHSLIFGYGIVSDDTDHTIFVSQALMGHPEDPAAFARDLAWSLRWWLMTLPPGVGLATLRSGIKLWMGFNPENSGVYSAGNGAAMRSAVIGAFFASDQQTRRLYLRAATRITHTDPRALIGAVAVAELAAWVVRNHPERAPDLDEWQLVLEQAAGSADPIDVELSSGYPPGDFSKARQEWLELVTRMVSARKAGLSVTEFAAELGQQNGVSGFVYRTVPVAVYAWHRLFRDYAATIEQTISCGGDTDTSAAIAGALAWVTVGESGIPKIWLNGLFDWPRSINHSRIIAQRMVQCLEDKRAQPPVRYFFPGLLIRNLIALGAIFGHVGRRLLPPY